MRCKTSVKIRKRLSHYAGNILRHLLTAEYEIGKLVLIFLVYANHIVVYCRFNNQILKNIYTPKYTIH